MRFEELGLTKSVLRAATAAGYETATPIQAQAIPVAIQGKDVLGCAQTGTGKTAAFAMPILHRLVENAPAAKDGKRKNTRRVRALALAPTRELACQIAESFQEYGQFANMRGVVIYGGVSQGPQTRALQRGVDIVVATPGRLLDLIQQGYVDLQSVETLVLDEADRMLDMGFLPDIRRIIAELPTERQTLFFSATMPSAIRQLADSVLNDPVQIRIEPKEANTELITQTVFFVPQRHKTRLLDHYLASTEQVRAVVFTRTKHGAESLVEKLADAGYRAESIHGNKTQNMRQRALNNFKRNRTQILVATDVAARGIDVDDITHVFNFDLPHEPETYVHRIGRTGRAGATGTAVSFCDAIERKHLRAIERQTRQSISLDPGSNDPNISDFLSDPSLERTPANDRRKSSGARKFRSKGKPSGGYGGDRRSRGDDDRGQKRKNKRRSQYAGKR